jgi:hypothetical protein
MPAQFYLETLKGRDHLGDPSVDVIITGILKCIFKKWDVDRIKPAQNKVQW